MDKCELNTFFSAGVVSTLDQLAKQLTETHSVLGLAYTQKKETANSRDTKSGWCFNIFGNVADYSKCQYIEIGRHKVVIITPSRLDELKDKSYDINNKWLVEK